MAGRQQGGAGKMLDEIIPEGIKRIVFALIGLGLLMAAFHTASNTVAFLGSASRASGTVYDTAFGGSHPDIWFQTASGQTVSYPQNGFISGFKPGDRVTVLYSAENPAHTATIDAIGAVWFWTILSGLLGTGLLLGGVSSALGRAGPILEGLFYTGLLLSVFSALGWHY